MLSTPKNNGLRINEIEEIYNRKYIKMNEPYSLYGFYL